VQLSVRPAVPPDIAEIVRLQIANLQGSVITEFGPAFLMAFHASALCQGSTRGFVACDSEGRVLGFVLGTVDVTAFNRAVKRDVVLELLTALAAPARWKLVGAVARSITEAEPRPHIDAELLLLVVDPSVRRIGLGRRLLVALEAEFNACHVSRYRVAVRSHLEVARAYYLALGFAPEQELQVLGRAMTYLTKSLAS
jgi:ribosomal protein S18 acetylase RimI-like enzyme